MILSLSSVRTWLACRLLWVICLDHCFETVFRHYSKSFEFTIQTYLSKPMIRIRASVKFFIDWWEGDFRKSCYFESWVWSFYVSIQPSLKCGTFLDLHIFPLTFMVMYLFTWWEVFLLFSIPYLWRYTKGNQLLYKKR